LTIILNRPESLNALSQPLLEELAKVLEEAKYLPQIKALLITGEGKAFCAGADINQLAGLSAEEGLVFAKRGQGVFWALETLGKPSLAAINGFAFGGGCELAMSATMRIAGKPAKFGQPEVKLGVIPGFGGTQRLARLVGKGRALDLCLTGRFINSDEALAWGLVSEVTEPENLLARAQTILLGILDQGPLAVRAVMEVIQTGYDLNLADALHLEAVQFALTCASEDKNEGVQAFLGKRKAVFTGK
jgi:enoyl-CoA hydratase